MPEPGKAFDAAGQFHVKHLSPDGRIATIEIRFPSDEEWCERESRRKSIIEFDVATGEPKQSTVPPDEDESILVKRLSPALVEIDPMEAGRLLDQLAFFEVVNQSSIVSADKLVVELLVFQASTVHEFRMPTSRELDKFQTSGCDQRSIGKRKVSSVRNLRLTQRLYSDMKKQVSGYAGAVPIIHQCAAVFAAFEALQAELNTSRNP